MLIVQFSKYIFLHILNRTHYFSRDCSSYDTGIHREIWGTHVQRSIGARIVDNNRGVLRFSVSIGCEIPCNFVQIAYPREQHE